MNDAVETRQNAVAAVLSGVAKKTAVIVSLVAVAVLIFSLLRSIDRWWFLPLSILFGGGLGLLNFRWLAIAVQKVYLRQGATPGVSNIAAAIISIVKLFIIFIILFVVIKWQLLHVFGLVAGLSFCFLAIVWEGATALKDNLKNNLQ
jgi:hypothetical protein